ncbi:MAG: MBL fold metallo-hydrolase [Alphaproteobacteria bacterium]
MAIPFIRNFPFEYGRCDTLAPGIRRVIANNPGPFTFTGTGTYILGEGEVAVIDPGPLMDSHLDALKTALAGETVTHILITHTHKDHSPLAASLKAWCGAATYGFGPHGSGRAEGSVALDEGGDLAFRPDVTVRDADVIHGKGWSVEAVHTPGHTSNHLSFAYREAKALFCGDHVMGWSTTVVAPPDGNMADYFASLDKILARDDESLWPTHGAPVLAPERDVRSFIQAFIEHRRGREAQILDALAAGETTITAMVRRIYADVDTRLHPAAALSVHAHLIHLVETGRVLCEGAASLQAVYRPA